MAGGRSASGPKRPGAEALWIGRLWDWRLWLGVAMAALVVAPLVPLALWSVARGWYFPNILPAEWTLAPWRHALSDRAGVLDSLWTSLAVSAAVTGLALILGVPAGRALGLYRFRGKPMVELLVLAPVIVPGIAVVLGLHSVFIGLGLTNRIAGVVIVHLIPVLPYVILVVAGVFARYDPAQEAQARSLGARPWQVLWHITLPAVLPGVVAAALFAFLVSWGQYILTLVIGGGRVVTLPLLLFSFVSSGRNDIAGAIGLIYILPGVLMLAFGLRHIAGRDGFAAGGRG